MVFAWRGGIGTAIAVLFPLTQHLPVPLATAPVNLGSGLTIIGLVNHTTAASTDTNPGASASTPDDPSSSSAVCNHGKPRAAP